MSLTKAWSLIVVLAVAAIAPQSVFAQTADISCLPSYAWMNNTKNQNPCVVASYLEGICVGGQYTIDPLPANTHYIGPYLVDANPCECNTVTYSMISACGTCQNRTIENWSIWSYNCSIAQTSNATFPMDIPSGTAVPHWAYLDVMTGDTFNLAAAQLAGDTPESTATKVQSTGSVITFTTGASASLTSPAIATSSNGAQSPTSTSKSSNVGAIAGGVVGGVVGVAAIASIAAWFFVRRRRSTTAPSAAFSDIGGGPGYTQSVYSTNPHPFPQPQMAQQPRLYDPSDPTTFPTSPTSPTINTTSSNIYQNPSMPSQLYSQQSRPGQYSGVPEV